MRQVQLRSHSSSTSHQNSIGLNNRYKHGANSSLSSIDNISQRQITDQRSQSRNKEQKYYQQQQLQQQNSYSSIDLSNPQILERNSIIPQVPQQQQQQYPSSFISQQNDYLNNSSLDTDCYQQNPHHSQQYNRQFGQQMNTISHIDHQQHNSSDEQMLNCQQNNNQQNNTRKTINIQSTYKIPKSTKSNSTTRSINNRGSFNFQTIDVLGDNNYKQHHPQSSQSFINQKQFSSIQTPVHNSKQSSLSINQHQQQLLAAQQQFKTPIYLTHLATNPTHQHFNKNQPQSYSSAHTSLTPSTHNHHINNLQYQNQPHQQQQQLLSNQEIRAIQSQFQEFAQITQTTKHLEQQLSKFKRLVEQKREYLKQMDREIQNKQKINEKREKVYKDIKVKQGTQDDKIRVKKQQLRVKLEQYQKKKQGVQAESEHLLILEKDLRTLKDSYEQSLESYNTSRSTFDTQKLQYIALNDTKSAKYTNEIETLRHQLAKLQDKNTALEQKQQQLAFKQKNLDANDMDLRELEVRIGEEHSKLEGKRKELLSEEKVVKGKKRELQGNKEVELLASEELKKTECILFDKENREYDTETKYKDLKTAILHQKRINAEKEDEVRCKRDEANRKQRQLEDEDDRLCRLESELEDETSCAHYCINELKKKLRELESKHDEVRQREQILKERLKIEGKIELELASLEFNQERLCRQREDQEKQYEIEWKIIRDKEECLRQREMEVRKKESKVSVRASNNSLMKVKGIFQDIDQWSDMNDITGTAATGKSMDLNMHPNKENLLLTHN